MYIFLINRRGEVNFKKLLYFKTIVEQGQISRAARVLHISQPPLSQRLKEMEDDLDTTLIERTGSNWTVTPAGKALYQRALQVLDLVEDIPVEVKRAQGAVQGLVTIGCTTLSLSVLHHFLPAFTEKYADISCRLFINDSAIQYRMLKERVLDFCIMLTPGSHSGLCITPLNPSELCAVIPPALASEACRAAARDGSRLALEELARLPLMPPRRLEGGSLYGSILAMFALHGMTPRVVMDCPDCTAILSFMESGMTGVPLVPASEVPARMREKYMVCSLPEEAPKVQPCIGAVKGRYLPLAAVTAKDELIEFATGGCAPEPMGTPASCPWRLQEYNP